MKNTIDITASELDAAAQRGTLTPEAAQWAKANLAYLNRPMRLFGKSQKVKKGDSKRETYVMYLQPADKVAGQTLCPVAEVAGCKDACLISSGQLGMTSGQNAATKRTILFLLRPIAFEGQLARECEAAHKRYKAGRTERPLFRLNGTSDIDWTAFIQRHPQWDFYDYTKRPNIARKARGLLNYDVTFSGSMYSETSRRLARKAIGEKHRVAFAVNSKGLDSDADSLQDLVTRPASSRFLLNFDLTDLRPLDPQFSVGLLSRKGSNKTERAAENTRSDSFFITAANVNDWLAMVLEAMPR
jgi:hypothetical protein